jgi:hypothetical protein
MEGSGTTTVPEIRLSEFSFVGSDYVGFKPPMSITTSTVWTLPDGDGTSGQALSTNGSGTLSWQDFASETNPTFNGTAAIYAAGGGTLPAKIMFYDNDGSNTVTLRIPDSVSANYTITLPTTDGNSGQVLQTDGSGNTSWTNKIGTSGTTANGVLTYTSATSATVESNLTFDGSTLTVNANAQIRGIAVAGYKTGTPVAGQTFNGTRYASTWTTSFSVTAGDVYYLNSGGGNLTWSSANASAESTGTGLLVIATSNGNSTEMALQGNIRTNTNLSSGTIGDKVYLSTTSGKLTLTAPSGTTGYIVRVVGYLVNPTYSIVYFNPSNDWVELS